MTVFDGFSIVKLTIFGAVTSSLEIKKAGIIPTHAAANRNSTTAKQ